MILTGREASILTVIADSPHTEETQTLIKRLSPNAAAIATVIVGGKATSGAVEKIAKRFTTRAESRRTPGVVRVVTAEV
jgi:hypothetical protein